MMLSILNKLYPEELPKWIRRILPQSILGAYDELQIQTALHNTLKKIQPTLDEARPILELTFTMKRFTDDDEAVK